MIPTRRHIRFLSLCSAAVFGLLVWPVSTAAEWLPVQGRGAIQGSYERALFQAERQALSRGLARYLQQWLSVEEIEAQSTILNERMFNSPRGYVLATSSVSTRQAGIQAIWQGMVQYNHQRVEAALRDFGLINAWDITPIIAVTVATEAAQAVSQAGWYRLLSESGFELVTRTDDVKHVHGYLRIHLDQNEVTHPLDPNRMLVLSDVVISGRIAGTHVSGRIPLAPKERQSQSRLAASLVADQMLSAWAPEFLRERSARQWTAGEFMFNSTAQWLAFDREITKNRALFHRVYPHLVERRSGRLFITYRFFLNEDDLDTALSWLAVNQFDAIHVPPRTLSLQ